MHWIWLKVRVMFRCSNFREAHSKRYIANPKEQPSMPARTNVQLPAGLKEYIMTT